MEDAESIKEGQFRIRVRKGDWEVEVSAPDKDFVLEESNRLMDQFRLSSPVVHSPQVEVIQGEVTHLPELSQSRTAKPQTLNEFFRQFKFQTNLEKTLVLGYWCEIRQGQHFTPEDILAKYKEVKEPAPANIRRDLSNLVGKGLLLTSGKSEDGLQAYELTNSGIREVESKLSQE